jgi:hypothetical protein
MPLCSARYGPRKRAAPRFFLDVEHVRLGHAVGLHERADAVGRAAGVDAEERRRVRRRRADLAEVLRL